MSPTSRRIFLYWLLLLVPTLVVGGGAIQLLRREQARLAESSAYADEARRAAVTARARLIVENVELLVGDVEAGLLDTLAAEPADQIVRFFEHWERSNPLVRTAFLATPDGRMLWPDARAGSEEGRGFLRRFSREFATQLPWKQSVESKVVAPAKREQELLQDEAVGRKEVAANVAQVQSARRDVQELFKNQNAYSSQPGSSSGAMAPGASMPKPASAETIVERARGAEADRQRGASKPVAETARARSDNETRLARSASAPSAPAASAIVRARDAVADRRGWIPQRIDGRMHLLGWIQPAGAGEVRGVEVELAALISRLGGALPAEPGNSEGYVLRDEQGRVLHQAGAVGRGGVLVTRVPLAASLLPGWEVLAFLIPGPAASGNGAGFFWAGVMLVAIFIAAILSGGSLLLRQARRSEEEATQKTSFVANVSHEFKTPLTTIRLYAELLEQGRVRDQAQGGEYLRTIGRETERLARLVNNALDFSRLEQGRKKYAHDSFNLAAELGSLLDTHAPRIAEAGLALKRELPAEPVMVTSDREAIGQIVLNLLDNACKYAAAGGEVTVGVATRADGGAEVRVSDRGPGVSPEHRERVFEKFHRVDDALTAEKTGAGLGLSIARQLARGLGGELSCVPRAGAGAEFVLELP